MTESTNPGSSAPERPDAPTCASQEEVHSIAAIPPRTRAEVLRGDVGMTTAEYAIGTVAACGFGAVLYKAVTSDAVARLLRGVIEQALSVSFL